MKNIGSEHPSPEGLQSVFTAIDPLAASGKKSAHLLELRTENGPVYVRPSDWQRFWLRRAFRHFRELPPQLLSRRNQRLVATLLRTAVVTPQLPVAHESVFGVVEKVHAKSAEGITRVAAVGADPRAALALVVRPAQPALRVVPRHEPAKEIQGRIAPPEALVVSGAALRPWVAMGATAAACIPLIMASVYGVSQFSSAQDMKEVRDVPAAIQQAAKDIPLEAADRTLPVLPTRVSLPAPHKRKNRVPADLPQPAEETSQTAPAMAERRFVLELPPGHFAHPVVPSANLVGELRLKALIGADGSVKQVTVLSGDPRLAHAGMRAVMQWHYSPYQVLGNPVAVETEIKMSFFGPDAVSIASVADGRGSQLP